MFCGAKNNDRMFNGRIVGLNGCHFYEVGVYDNLKTDEDRISEMEKMGLKDFHQLENFLTLCVKCHVSHFDNNGSIAIDPTTHKLIISTKIRREKCSTGAVYGSLHGKEIIFKNRRLTKSDIDVVPPHELLVYRFKNYFEHERNFRDCRKYCVHCLFNEKFDEEKMGIHECEHQYDANNKFLEGIENLNNKNLENSSKVVKKDLKKVKNIEKNSVVVEDKCSCGCNRNVSKYSTSCKNCNRKVFSPTKCLVEKICHS
jgi:hypothetical protein